jgi:glycosyltransferase involved in cell wall biosynthesis
LLEAWARGKPVVAAGAGGIPAVIDDGENGFMIKFGDV